MTSKYKSQKSSLNLFQSFPRLDYFFVIWPTKLMHYICVGYHIPRSQGCVFGSDPSETQGRPEGIFRNQVSLVFRILEKTASEPLVWSPLPHSSCTVGRSLIKQNSLLSLKHLEKPPPKYTPSIIQYITDVHVLFTPPHPLQDSCIFFFSPQKFDMFSFVWMYIKMPQSSIMCSMTGICGREPKRMEISFVIHKCGLHCLSVIQTDSWNRTFNGYSLSGSNSYY